jgi:hypothetical protein
MNKRTEGRPTTDQIMSALEDVPWYGIAPLSKAGNLLGQKFFCIGPDLVPGFVSEHARAPIPPGVYGIGAWIPKGSVSLPDWGTLTVRGPGSWVMRSRDGRIVWVADGTGKPVSLRTGGAA